MNITTNKKTGGDIGRAAEQAAVRHRAAPAGALRPGGFAAAGRDPPPGPAGYEPLHETRGVSTTLGFILGCRLQAVGCRL